MSDKERKGDASGRGFVEGYKVNFPPLQHGYADETIDAVVSVMKSMKGQTQGEYMVKFQEDFKTYTGAKHAFAVDNATNALRLAALLCQIGEGDEVIIPAYTFCATAIPFGMTGAKIVWSDVDRERWVADPADIERKITDQTKVIVVVHLLGMPVDMKSIMDIAVKHNLKVVEDCAQAIGAKINGQHIGTFGDFGCFSFHGAKALTTLGEGGMLTVASDDDAALVPGIRHNGCRSFEGERERYWDPAMSSVDIDIEGLWPNNFCIGEVQCAAGSSELAFVDKNTDILIQQADKIKSLLNDTPEIDFHVIPDGYRHVYHQFIMHFNSKDINKTRNDLLDILVNEYKIRCIVQYYPLYRYPLFQKLGAGEQDCPVLESWWDDTFSFPWWCGIDDETIEYLTSSLKAAIAKLKEK